MTDKVKTVEGLFKPFLVGESDEWQIILAPVSTKCAWMVLDLNSKINSDCSYRIKFNTVYRRTDNGEDWNRLMEEFPDAVSWFYDTLDKRFPFCEICMEYWKNNGCIFDEM